MKNACVLIATVRFYCVVQARAGPKTKCTHNLQMYAHKNENEDDLTLDGNTHEFREQYKNISVQSSSNIFIKLQREKKKNLALHKHTYFVLVGGQFWTPRAPTMTQQAKINHCDTIVALRCPKPSTKHG